MGVITLTPGQAVTLHSWSRPKQSLQWEDVVENDKITFTKCRECNLSLKQLHSLQPDIREWKHHGGVSLKMLPEMCHLWQVHPIHDMGADLGDLITMRWSAETLRKMGITMEDLKEIGLTADNMCMFGYTLMGWWTHIRKVSRSRWCCPFGATLMGWLGLGLVLEDINIMSEPQIARTFGLTKVAAQRCVVDSQNIVLSNKLLTASDT